MAEKDKAQAVPAPVPRTKIESRTETKADGTVVSLKTTTISGRALKLLDDFSQVRSASAANPADQTLALDLYETGALVIRTRCDLYFRAIGRGARDAGLATREIGIAAAALTAGLSLIGASAGEIASVPIGAGFATGSISNFADAFFFSPDVQPVKDLVNKAFKAAHDNYVTGPDRVTNYRDAVDALRETQDVCTGHQIKSLINKAVAAGTVIVRYDADVAASKLTADAGTAAVGGKLGVILTTDQLIYIYGYVQGERSAEFKKSLCATLPGAVVQTVCTAARDDFNTINILESKRTDLVTVFGSITAADPTFLSSRLAALIASLKPKLPGEVSSPVVDRARSSSIVFDVK